MSAALATKPKRRAYGNADNGEKIVSVTQVLKSLGWATEGLMHWSSGVAVDEAIRMINAGVPIEDVRKLARGAHLKKRDAAADAGTAAHAMVEAYLRGEDPEDAYDPMLPSETVLAARAAFGKFVNWWSGAGYTVVESELLMVDRVVGFGGTPDLILRAADGTLVVADVKTGKRYYDEVALQLAAYAMLARKHGHNVRRGLVIHVPVDGEPSFPEVNEVLLGHLTGAFTALLVVHASKKLIKFDIEGKV